MNSREKNASSKKRVYLIPHTHWDREWYFTYQTANVLLHHDFNEFEKLTKGKWFLDGQWSLVNDLVKWSSTRRQRIEEAISKGDLSVGPLYSQPDVFNSQGETIIRNFEMGAKMAQEFKTPQLKTAYLPDTFGFGQNMPQILKHCKMDYFVFWRGLNEEQLAKNDFFIWKGIDGSKIKVLVLREGYFSLGMHYPYNEGLIWPHKNNPSHFLDKVLNRINKIKGTHKSYILPLGGDQAPFLYSQNTFVQKLNSLSLDYSFILDSNFDKYLSGKNFTSVFEGDLRTPITGKIHRTITSSRYDIKKDFREAEDKLYYLLEPLEFFYANYNNIYDFEKYKDENILKPLFLAQAHDSLGGCNTDTTNQNQLSRLKLIQENIESQVDLLLKKIIQDSKIPTETITIFNPAPFFNNMAQRQIIYSTIPGSVAIDKPYLKLKTLSSKNISFNKDKPLFKKEVLVYAQRLSPLSLTKASLAKIKKIDLFETAKANLEIEKNKLVFLIGKQKVKFSLIIKKDNGDAYDSSPGTHVPIKIKLLKAFTTKMGKMKFTSVLARVNKCRVQIDFF